MGHFADLLQLRALPGGYRIFLRPWYDRLNPMLRQIAGLHRRFFLTRTRIVVVVGSLGKTTTRRTLHAALDCSQRNFSFSNYGSCLSENLLRLRPRDRHGVLEVGVSGPGNMQPHADMIRPDVVVATSIKSEHNRSFPTLLDTRAEEVKMVAALPANGLAVLNGDDPHVRWMATQTRARVLFYGLDAANDVRATNLRSEPGGGATFDVHIGSTRVGCRSALIGEHMVYPMLAAIAVAHAEKINLADACGRLARLHGEKSRMELLEAPGGIRILDDSFKGALESIHAAFDACAAMPAKRRILVLGNVEEPPGNEGDIYRDLGTRAARFADVVICIGKQRMQAFRAGAVQAGMAHTAIRLAGSRIEAGADLLKTILQPGDLVLIKGSNRQRLSRLALRLSGMEVNCSLHYCNAKVNGCNACPLLKTPANWQENHFIRRVSIP